MNKKELEKQVEKLSHENLKLIRDGKKLIDANYELNEILLGTVKGHKKTSLILMIVSAYLFISGVIQLVVSLN